MDINSIDYLKDTLQTINKKRKNHFIYFRYYKRLNMYLNTIVNILNTVTVLSIVITFHGHYYVYYLSSLCTTISALLTVYTRVFKVPDKCYKHQTSYLQYKDIYNMYIPFVLQSSISNNEIQEIIQKLNIDLQTVSRRCEPIKLGVN